jgi:hypothetical protein
MAAMEYDTAVEGGMDPQEAWDFVLPDSDQIDRIRHAPRRDRLVPLEDPLHFYLTSSPEQLRANLPGNAFATCPDCKLTYLIDYQVMAYAAGRAIHTQPAKAVIVHPGRVISVGPHDSGPAFGIEHSWRPTPWAILGQDTAAPMA